MALRTNPMVVMLASLVRLYPKTSIATAFEVGMLAAAALRSLRARRSLTAVIDAVALPVPAPSRRKPKTARTTAPKTTRKRKPAARRVRASTPAIASAE